MNLYTIASKYLEAFNALTDTDDMPEEAILDTLEGIEGEFNEKALAVAAYIKNLEAEAVAIKDAYKRMKERHDSKMSKVESLERYLIGNMQKIGVKKVESSELLVQVKANPEKVIIDNDKEIPIQYVVERVEISFDKNGIKKALQEGVEINGAHLEREFRLAIK